MAHLLVNASSGRSPKDFSHSYTALSCMSGISIPRRPLPRVVHIDVEAFRISIAIVPELKYGNDPSGRQCMT